MTDQPRASRVVVADDDVDIRRLVEMAVRRAGASVAASVGDGLAAAAAVAEHVPDLAILDVSMPGRTGLEVCRALRADAATRNVRVLILSAAVQPEAVEAGRAAGADEYALKPFSPRTLAEKVRSMLSAAGPGASTGAGSGVGSDAVEVG